MKKFIYFFLLFLTVQNCLAQKDKKPFFISGSPGFAYADEMVFFKSILYKYESIDSLAIVDTLSNGDRTETTYVKVYQDKKKAFIYERLFPTDSNALVIIDFSSGIKVSNHFTTLPPDYYNSHLIDNEDIFVFGTIIKDDTILFKGITERLKVEYVNPEQFSNSMIIGSAGPAVEGSDFLLIYINSEDRSIKIPVTKKIEKRPSLPIKLPVQVEVSGRRAILVNNEEVTVIILDHSDYGNEVGYSGLIIFDKNSNKWINKQVKVNIAEIKYSNQWLTGFVSSHFLKFKESPGAANRSTTIDEHGFPFDHRVRNKELYLPGILYLFHIPTENYIEWSTGQGDSEILLVEDETVYYRVNDEIYQALIIDGKKLGKPELLLKDDRVPDIHWAFFSRQ